VVKVITANIGATSICLDFDGLPFDGQQRGINDSSAELEYDDVALAAVLTFEAVSNGNSGRLVDNLKNFEASDGK
jgi:hypothetical protein